MKKLLFIAMLAMSFIGCKKETETQKHISNSIVGTWSGVNRIYTYYDAKNTVVSIEDKKNNDIFVFNNDLTTSWQSSPTSIAFSGTYTFINNVLFISKMDAEWAGSNINVNIQNNTMNLKVETSQENLLEYIDANNKLKKAAKVILIFNFNRQ